ncbi:period circadian protein homolog 2 isoform X1 [Gambusia affinis]|uniref:period circadian protein homolog 2 isoform X1 n=2 Tax=Gambusia affinis TaxID=33528 RepID=UPI001CDC1A34|nr:period circadian protein homolog 2 isoform X1 [Gambusia affinis]XP_043989697.1 period circadian protein homolog 2 isoform X1 [Gambusia affinis]XP_043989698.1 period circadian protein homolog 2 isoform X1 [Gambusia affinis]
MSDDSDSKPYPLPVPADRDGASASSSPMAQMRWVGSYAQGRPDLGLPSEGSDSSGQDPAVSPHNVRKTTRSRLSPEEDVEMKSSGSSGSGTESHGNESHGNESHGNDSNGHESTGSSNSRSKDSALLESSGSNKSSNSHSPSPPSSSNAYSLLSSEQDNPSTSGCSSQESAKAKNQKEVLKTLKELKLHMPADKQHNSKSTTLSALKYALRCVKQVEANEEYYQMMMVNDSQPSGLDVSSYTIEEIDSITSEYTLKNNDIFAVAVSLGTGKIIYISDQAASILNCKRDAFKDSKFVEFLMPQDISVFYSFTTPYRLPSWSMCTGADPSPSDCMQEKSFFCRISGGNEFEGDLRYYPFRMTPYLMKVQDMAHDEDQFCCLLLAERVHSGYEAPRIPPDKRIFTTTHTPNCVFQDVDARAVPLLGYLPQDLIGTPILFHLHPNDWPVMLAIHRKIIQYAGQPFDHSSIRFCAQNGEYIVLDTSWSTFVNPWSKKVSFVIGRHKVRMGPMNEDIFMAPVSCTGHMKNMDSDIQEITEQIHRLLLQPVHNSGSSGYSSLNSNEYLQGMTSSSSESLNNGKQEKGQEKEGEQSSKSRPRTFQEICKGIHLQKQQTAKSEHKRSNTMSGQNSQAVVRLKDSAPPISWRETTAADSRVSFHEELDLNNQTVCSYQQISCLDSVIRYLESYNVPVVMKRKCQSSSNTTSSNSDEDKQKKSHAVQISEEPTLSKDQSRISALNHPHKKTSDPATAVVGTSMPLPVPNKPESVVSITSQCSYSSTIVHVGDKKPHPESEITEDVPVAGDMPESSQNINTPRPVSPPSQEMESYKKLGLTKQVLAAHTQKEEQTFLCRIRELRGLTPHKANGSLPLDQQRDERTVTAAHTVQPRKQEGQRPERMSRRGTRNKKTKTKRAKLLTSPSTEAAPHKERQPQQPPPHPQTNQSHTQTPVSPSNASQPAFPAPYPVMLPGYPMQIYARTDSAFSRTEAPLQDLGNNQGVQLPLLSPGTQPAPVISHMVTPVMAFVLPNYLYPSVGHPVYQVDAGGVPMQAQPFDQTAFPSHAAFATPPFINGQNQLNPTLASYLSPPVYFPSSPDTPKPPEEGHSCSSTPQSGESEGQTSPPLFQSRCSSPLNLLELEFSVDRQDNAPHASVGQGSNMAEREKGASASKAKEREMKEPSLSLLGPPGPLYFQPTSCVCERLSWDKVWSRLGAGSRERSDEGNNSDVISTSSDMLDIILQEDSCSGTGSATSGSLGSGSNGFGTSASGMSKSRTSASSASASGASSSFSGSNNSSKYFGSVDSSQSSQKHKRLLRSSEERPAETGLLKCVLQDPVWLLMANTEEKVMMTYELPSRDIDRVLEEDNEKIRMLQQCQPHFSVDQKKELCEVHPWIEKGELPKAINVEGCTWCDNTSETASTVGAEDQPDLGVGDTEIGEDCCPERLRGQPLTSDLVSCHSGSPSNCSPRAEEANQQEF